MPLSIVRNDITRVRADAIVNSTNPALIPAGHGVDAAIHAAAGPALAEALSEIGASDYGEAVMTPAFGELESLYVIHTCPPPYFGDEGGGRELLERCYVSSLRLALDRGLRSVAFPLLSAGAYAYPVNEAYSIATAAIRGFLIERECDIEVILCLFNAEAVRLSRRIDGELKKLISDSKAEKIREELRNLSSENEYITGGKTRRDLSGSYREHLRRTRPRRPEDRSYSEDHAASADEAFDRHAEFYRSPRPSDSSLPPAAAPKTAFETFSYHALSSEYDSSRFSPEDLDISFGQAVCRMVEERGIKPSEFYTRANISKAVYSSLKTKPWQIPKRGTAFACVIGLRLSPKDANALLARAGI